VGKDKRVCGLKLSAGHAPALEIVFCLEIFILSPAAEQ
jgi:hypothetical protein